MNATLFSLHMTVAKSTKDQFRVGVPLAERTLTHTLELGASHIFSPGIGRSMFHLQEVELGTGRPDSILIALSSTGLEARIRSGLRIPSLAHARELEAVRLGQSSRYSTSHSNRLMKSLRELGWITRRNCVARVPNLISNSVTIEAKMSDWKTGVCQLSKARWATHLAALLVPYNMQHRVSRKALCRNRLGLLVVNSGSVKWRIRPPHTCQNTMADLWLTELVIRAIESK